MALRSLRRRLARFLFGPSKAIEHKILSGKSAEVCTRRSIGVENCRCFDCHCEERARRAAVNSSDSLQKPPQRPIDPNDPLYPPCQLDEKDMCYWYYAREDYLVLPLLRELFGPNRPFWLKIYPNFPIRRDRRYPRTVLFFPQNITQDEENAALYILEWGRMPPPGNAGWPIPDKQ